MPTPNQPSGNRKGKTLTVLFKSEMRRKNAAAEATENIIAGNVDTQPNLLIHGGGGSNVQLETPGMMRDNSKDEFLQPGMVASARYNNGNADKQATKEVNESPEKYRSKRVSPGGRVHKINVLGTMNTNSGETSANVGAGSSSY